MLPALTLLLVFQLIGEAARLALGLPVPGPVIGLALLLGWLILRGGPSADLRGTTGGLLQHLSLLFVPGGHRGDAACWQDRTGWLPIVGVPGREHRDRPCGRRLGPAHTLMQRAGRQEQSR